jgi:hypothetical protein
MTGTPAPEFRVDRVLVRGFSILARNAVPFGLLALAFTAPPHIYALAVDQPSEPAAATASTGSVAIFIADVLLRYLLAAALVYGTIRELRGSHVNLVECLSRGLSLVFPVVGVAILVGVATVLATLLLIVPGFIVATMLWVAVPVAVVERPGILNSLTRSAELTKGYRWPVFGVLATVIALNVVLAIVAGSLVAGEDDTTAFVLVSWIVSAIFGAVIAVVSAVSYHDLRVAKEDPGAIQITAAFD